VRKGGKNKGSGGKDKGQAVIDNGLPKSFGIKH
jgi:hypothetical protein